MENRDTQDILSSVLNSLSNNLQQYPGVRTHHNVTDNNNQDVVDLPEDFQSLSDDERVRLVMEQLQNLSNSQNEQVNSQQNSTVDIGALLNNNGVSNSNQTNSNPTDTDTNSLSGISNSDMELLTNQIERRNEESSNPVANILNSVTSNLNRQLRQGYVNENCIKSNYSEGYKDSINEYANLKTNKLYFDGFNFNISDDDEVYFSSVESTIEGTFKAILGKKDIGDRVNSKLKECLKTNYVTNNVYSSGDSYMYFRNGLLNIIFKKDGDSDLQNYDVNDFDNLFNLITVYYSTKDSKVYFIYTDELMYDYVNIREDTVPSTLSPYFY